MHEIISVMVFNKFYNKLILIEQICYHSPNCWTGTEIFCGLSLIRKVQIAS